MNVDFGKTQTKADKMLQDKLEQLKQIIDTLPLEKVKYFLNLLIQ